jgi:hypothetical protein
MPAVQDVTAVVDDGHIVALARPVPTDSSVDALIWLVGRIHAVPKHFYSCYTTQELDLTMTSRPATTRPCARPGR